MLSQERYFRDSAPAGAAAPLWQIPVCLQSSSGDSRCEVLQQKRQEISFNGCPAWVMGNAGARGYYRAAISPAMVRTMAEKVETLSPAERMAVLSDEWALVRAGRHDVGTFMDLASGFTGERTAAVMQTLGTLLRAAGEEFATGSTANMYRAWVGKLIAPALRDVGVPGSPSDDDERKALRAAVVAIAGGIARDPQLLATSRQLVRAGARQARHGRADAARPGREPRGASRRCGALRPLPEGEQGGDPAGGPISVSCTG